MSFGFSFLRLARHVRPGGYSTWIGLQLLLASWVAVYPVRAELHGDVPKVNLIGANAGFEQPASSDDNLWDGVDSDGYLHVAPFNAQVVTERGNFGGLAMPPSVAFVDLNGDGLPDLVVADPTGYFHFYPNTGTRTAPRFTSAELIPIWLSSAEEVKKVTYDVWRKDFRRYCPRISMADWRRTGLLDMMIGNYEGEILFLPNLGTAHQPVFRVPEAGPLAAELPTNDQGRLWANLFSPVAVDWNGDGKLDLVLGEGTYSANAIHLLENVGSADTPKFSSSKHTYIAYGYGREQLIPTVADYNGDGNPDLLVADRTGEVGVYLNPGKPQVGLELKRASTISFGGTTKLPGLAAPYAADFNGDGLFDLIFGLPNGRIGVALNTGTKGNPSFGPVQELKGVDRLGRNVRRPPGWTADSWPDLGNALAYFSVVSAQDDPASQPPEGKYCLKAGYWPMVGQAFLMPSGGMPGGSRHFTLRHAQILLKQNKTYHLSFKVKGTGMEHLHSEFFSHYEGFAGLAKIETDERGAVVHNNDFVYEDLRLGSNFSIGSNWQTVESSVTPRFKNPILKDEKEIKMDLVVEFDATSLTSEIYFDDFQLTEAGAGGGD